MRELLPRFDGINSPKYGIIGKAGLSRPNFFVGCHNLMGYAALLAS